MSERLLQIITDSFTKILLPGLTVTIPLTIISFIFAMIHCSGACHGAVCPHKSIKRNCKVLHMDSPGHCLLLVQLFCIFYGLPNLGIVLPPFPSAVIVFSINEGAYCAEVVRAALEAVPKGQMEAGYCVGMSYMQIMRRIVLPQAMRIAFPSLCNSLISMVKDTSLAANITVAEMFMATQKIVARTYEPLALYLEVGFIYLMFCTVLTKLQSLGEKKLAFYGKKGR